MCPDEKKKQIYPKNLILGTIKKSVKYITLKSKSQLDNPFN